MAAVDVLNQKGEKISQTDLPDEVFNVEIKPEVLHEVVVMQLANRRSATASVRHRSDVKGSTRKLFRQKGTGRARRGDIKSPLLRGGGVVFGPDGRNYAYKTTKKVRRLALKMALSSKLKESRIIVLDGLHLDEVKTKKFLEVTKALSVDNALFVIDQKDAKAELSSRNLPNIKVLRSEGLNVYDLLKYGHLILAEPCVRRLEERLLK
jgi:large subunit ribosomal protein L4